MNEILKMEIKKFGDKPDNQRLTDKGFDRVGYETAIRRATRDLTARTLTPIPRSDGKKLIDAFLTGEGCFLQKIEEYFSEDPRDETAFDEWHAEICNEILEIIQSYYTQKNGSSVCYGKAQKIVNMTLKGCYCLSGAREKETYFIHCHMALDSFTLNWYRKNGYQPGAEWSNLSQTQYFTIRDNIRKIAPDIDMFVDLTVLQKEFLIWPLEIMAATVKEVNKCLGGFVDEDYALDYFKQHKQNYDLLMAKIILGKENPNDLESGFIEWLHKIPKNQDSKKLAAQSILDRYGIE